jgi:glutamate synthase domain-containing protein 2
MGWWIALWVVLGLLALVFIHDVAQRRWPIIHNFPLVGHIRYWLIVIGPELRQYIVAQNREERPFDRHERNWIETSSLGTNNYFGFGTDADILKDGHTLIKQAGFPYDPPGHTRLITVDEPFHHDESYDVPAWKLIGQRHRRRRPYRPTSVINISAMSYGSLGRNAVEAMNRGAKLANCFQNTGEGGVAPYHLTTDADLVWQLGTGKFGARGADGEFSADTVAAVCQRHPQIKMLEIKLSQGAKPGKGGVLPGKKVTAEVSAIRGIPMGKDCISPNGHLEFHDAAGLIDFVEGLAEKTGLPVGIKSAVGKPDFWTDLARLMKARNEGPDFIAIDGGEGGTGAAPLTFADHVSLPFFEGFTRVYRIFLEAGIAGEITWIAAGKLGFPDKAITAFALGADLINVAREAMIAIGCIQAQQCHTNHCPAGVATSSWWLQRGLDPVVQAERFHRYVQTFRKELIALTHACGYEHPNDFTTTDLEISRGASGFVTLRDRYGYEPDRTPHLRSADATIRLTRRLVKPDGVAADAGPLPLKPAGELPKRKSGGR